MPKELMPSRHEDRMEGSVLLACEKAEVEGVCMFNMINQQLTDLHDLRGNVPRIASLST